jgi:hypothetical protein
MSSNLSRTCLAHHNDRHIQVRKDFFDLCAYDKADFNKKISKNGTKVKDEPNQTCMAMILRLLETLTDHNPEPWIKLSYTKIAEWLYNTYGENTVRNSIAVLMQRGYIIRKQENKASVPSYALNIPVIQSALDQQRKEHTQKGVESNSQGVESNSQGVESNSQGVESNSQGVESNSLRVLNSTPYKKEDKITHKIIKERKNGAPNVSTQQEATHSSIHSSHSQSQSSFSSSQEKQEEEVSFTEEEEVIYRYACQTIFKAKPPRKTPKLKSECAEIAKNVQTAEQFQSLVRALPYIQGQIHLKNLVNELNGWLQSLEAAPSLRGKPTGPHIAQQPTKSQEEIDRENEAQLAKFHARVAARKQAQEKQGAIA